MSAAKRKNNSEQPELPIEQDGKINGGVANSKPPVKANGNGESHVLAEDVPAIAHTPFAPGKIEQALHRRVNTSFLEYASYVIRDRE